MSQAVIHTCNDSEIPALLEQIEAITGPLRQRAFSLLPDIKRKSEKKPEAVQQAATPKAVPLRLAATA